MIIEFDNNRKRATSQPEEKIGICMRNLFDHPASKDAVLTLFFVENVMYFDNLCINVYFFSFPFDI